MATKVADSTNSTPRVNGTSWQARPPPASAATAAARPRVPARWRTERRPRSPRSVRILGVEGIRQGRSQVNPADALALVGRQELVDGVGVRGADVKDSTCFTSRPASKRVTVRM